MRIIFFFVAILFASCQRQETAQVSVPDANPSAYSISSTAVGDTFQIQVSVPDCYKEDSNNRFPTVYLLDADFYFPLMKAHQHLSEQTGTLPPFVLVGIGYGGLVRMDSLRTRDFTYPTAIPEYEMALSGKADRFLSFLETELIPDIDRRYRTETTNRTLVGHSLGGYFSLFAMQQELMTKKLMFRNFVAASPSVHYNQYYVLKQLEKLNTPNSDGPSVFISFGGLEDEEENDGDTSFVTSEVCLSRLQSALTNKAQTRTVLLSNLGHMDAAFPAFSKGLTHFLGESK
ncbi:MAG TPA: alpha/beta hydrolase-fold protein [Catalimonadaceae bacterium]|nr:alpha/beta hydrolase-fold protein [Catalimonadaceae bacterium]